MLKKWTILFLELLTVAAASFCIVHSDRFQEMIAPENYWHQKVHELEDQLDRDTLKLNSLKISLEKEKAIGSYQIKQAAIKARVLGLNAKGFEEKEKKEQEKRISDLKRKIDELIFSHREKKELFEQAQEKFQFFSKLY